MTYDEQMTLLADVTAVRAHQNQTRNDKKTPYIVHPRAVEQIAIQIVIRYNIAINQSWLRQVCKLHDVVEDTEVTIDDLIADGFDPVVIQSIRNITKHPIKGQENYLSYLNRVMSSIYSRIAKIADLEHNMSDLKPGNMLDKYVLAHYILTKDFLV